MVSGLDQLLLTPNARRRAGIETADPSKDSPTPVALLMAVKHGEIMREEYDQRIEPERARRAVELKAQGRWEQLERISDANMNRIEALINPDGMKPKLPDQDSKSLEIPPVSGNWGAPGVALRAYEEWGHSGEIRARGQAAL